MDTDAEVLAFHTLRSATDANTTFKGGLHRTRPFRQRGQFNHSPAPGRPGAQTKKAEMKNQKYPIGYATLNALRLKPGEHDKLNAFLDRIGVPPASLTCRLETLDKCLHETDSRTPRGQHAGQIEHTMRCDGCAHRMQLRFAEWVRRPSREIEDFIKTPLHSSFPRPLIPYEDLANPRLGVPFPSFSTKPQAVKLSIHTGTFYGVFGNENKFGRVKVSGKVDSENLPCFERNGETWKLTKFYSGGGANGLAWWNCERVTPAANVPAQRVFMPANQAGKSAVIEQMLNRQIVKIQGERDAARRKLDSVRARLCLPIGAELPEILGAIDHISKVLEVKRVDPSEQLAKIGIALGMRVDEITADSILEEIGRLQDTAKYCGSLSKLGFVATSALNGILANPNSGRDNTEPKRFPEEVASAAVTYARALLAELGENYASEPAQKEVIDIGTPEGRNHAAAICPEAMDKEIVRALEVAAFQKKQKPEVLSEDEMILAVRYEARKVGFLRD